MKSMTGYGVAKGAVGKGGLYVELKTINHRYCDCFLRIPPKMSALELKLREFLQTRLERGKIDLFLKEVKPVLGDVVIHINLDLAKQYQKALKHLQQSLKMPSKLDLFSLVGLSPFIQTHEKEARYDALWSQVEGLLAKAVAQVEKMRSREGAHLLTDQTKRLKALEGRLSKIAEASKKRSQKNHIAAVAKLAEGANKEDITEEIIRLKSHAKQYRSLLHQHGPIGRKLDFLIQEMHREINTVGAKACDAKVSGWVVECKALLENLREQVQNIV